MLDLFGDNTKTYQPLVTVGNYFLQNNV